MNLRQAVAKGEACLLQAGVTDARTDARLLLEWVTNVSLTEYALDPLRPMTEDQEKRYLEAIRKRCSRIPLQHITGEQEFMGLTFQVDPSVLIPRQDTELLVEEGLKRLKPGMQVLDLCTGSGCIIISLEHYGRKYNNIDETNKFTGSDISREALRTAEENARTLDAKVSFTESNLFEKLGTYDMILSNPPYIRTEEIGKLEEEVRCHDPILALDGKEDGLYFYRRIIREAGEHLTSGGWLLFEIGYDQKEQVIGLMEEAGYREIAGLKDLAGLDRVVVGRYDS